MPMILKSKARKQIVPFTTNISVGIYPHGIGGIDGREMVIGINFGDYRIFMKNSEFERIKNLVQKMKDDRNDQIMNTIDLPKD
jgi:hypothetical protein